MGSVKNAPKSGQPKCARTCSPMIVEKLKEIVKSDSRFSSQQIADMVGIPKAPVLGIL